LQRALGSLEGHLDVGVALANPSKPSHASRLISAGTSPAVTFPYA